MYAQYFGLRKNPFSLTPDPAFLFLTEQHREALVGLTYALTQRKGYVTLTGEVGTGKTTILARVLQFLPAAKLHFSLIMNPTLTPSEFLEMVLLDFGVQDIPSSKAQRIRILQNLLLQAEKQDKVSALVIDEAHKLSPENLEEIRLLGNFEATDRKILQIVLAGQPELDTALRRTDLRQLKQRIAMRFHIQPLVKDEVSKYVRHRWLRAGGAEPPFSPEALSHVAEVSRGIPRVINSLCDAALISAFAQKSTNVEEFHVREAAADLDLDALAVEDLPKERPDPPTELNRVSARNTDPDAAPLEDVPLEGPVPPPKDQEDSPPASVETLAIPLHDFPAMKQYAAPPKRSLLTRWAGKLGFGPREETT
jgi:general secretion pathway protein A